MTVQQLRSDVAASVDWFAAHPVIGHWLSDTGKKELTAFRNWLIKAPDTVVQGIVDEFNALPERLS